MLYLSLLSSTKGSRFQCQKALEMGTLRAGTFAPLVPFTSLPDIAETIRVLWTIDKHETPKAFRWRAKMLERFLPDKDEVLLEGLAR